MNESGDAGDAGTRMPRRDQPVPPPWFERVDETPHWEVSDSERRGHFSWPRTIGLLALVLIVIGVPLDFAMTYWGADDATARTNMALGFVWAVVIEVLAVWGLMRLVTRR